MAHSAPPTAGDGVTPTLSELIALRARVQAWPPPLRAAGTQSGPATAPLRGRGMDYAESRLYAPGDDARHIDWRITARTGRMHTKIFHAERDRVTLLLADLSPTLFFGTRRCFKSVLLARIGALAAWGAQRSGDRIGALGMTAAGTTTLIAPGGGARGVLRVLDALSRWYVAADNAADAPIDAGLKAAQRLLKPGSRLLALLDPRSVAAVEDSRWTALAAHLDAIAVLAVDPLELDPPRARVAFRVAGQQVELDLRDHARRAAWGQQFGAVLEGAQQRLRRLGWRVLVQRTDAEEDAILATLLPRRREAA